MICDGQNENLGPTFLFCTSISVHQHICLDLDSKKFENIKFLKFVQARVTAVSWSQASHDWIYSGNLDIFHPVIPLILASQSLCSTKFFIILYR